MRTPPPDPSARATIKQIATTLNVHQSTVSRALKNNSRISLAMRQKIQKLAQDLNYRPDPMLSSLIAYRKSRNLKTYQANLGWITNFPTRSGWREYERGDYFTGANRRANELGYKLEEFWLRESKMTPHRITQILRSRNIRGLLFVPQPRSKAHLSGDWSNFPAVTFGRNLTQPAFNHVDVDHFRSFVILMRQLKRLGYRRPGFAILPRIHEVTDRLWTAAYMLHQPLPAQAPLPIFMKENWTKNDFLKWLNLYEPDVVISHDDTILKWLEESGRKVPTDIGFALAAKHAAFSARCSGINENSEFVGETALNFLVDLINREERGVPMHTISTLIEGNWIEGSTLRHLNR